MLAKGEEAVRYANAPRPPHNKKALPMCADSLEQKIYRLYTSEIHWAKSFNAQDGIKFLGGSLCGKQRFS
jgi:hypothetical protein